MGETFPEADLIGPLEDLDPTDLVHAERVAAEGSASGENPCDAVGIRFSCSTCGVHVMDVLFGQQAKMVRMMSHLKHNVDVELLRKG